MKCIKLGSLILFITALCFETQARQAKNEPIRLVDDMKAAATIVHPNDVPLYALTAERLAEYIKKQTDIRLPIRTEGFKATRKETTIILDGTKNKALIKKYGLAVDLKSDRDDAYIIKALWHKGKPFIILAGNSPHGVKYAAYRLMEEVDVRNKDVSVRLMDIKEEPFLRTG